jgi:hypothetical protein
MQVKWTETGVTAAWYANGQAISNFDFALTPSRTAVELRLSGLPEGFVIDYGFEFEWGVPDSYTDSESLSMTGPGGEESQTLTWETNMQVSLLRRCEFQRRRGHNHA